MTSTMDWLRDMRGLAEKLYKMSDEAYAEAEEVTEQLRSPETVRMMGASPGELASLLTRQAKAAARGSAYAFAARELQAALRKSPVKDEVPRRRRPVPQLDICNGHPAGENDPMGETVYCDGACVRQTPSVES